MKNDVVSGILARVERSLTGRREIAQDAYNAFEFGVRVVAQPSSGFFYSVHKDQPVMARKIHVLPEDGGPAKEAFFCVAFAENSLRVIEAFAFSGKKNYFGYLPDSFIDEQPDCDAQAPVVRM
jgi:hypothetical protein